MMQQDTATLTPKSDEILIRVAAAGINRADLLQKAGHYPPPAGITDILGLEVAGTIAAIGSNVRDWQVGDTVCALLSGGGYAPYAIANQGCVLPIPDGYNMTEAAAITEAAFTVWNNIFVRGRLAAGEVLLLTGAASGIGTLALQLAKAKGAQVIALCRQAKQAAIVKLGADAVYDDRDPACWDAIKANHPRIDVVLDMVGGDSFARHLDLLATDGRHVSIAYLAGRTAQLDIATIIRKRLILTGSTLRGRPQVELTALRDDLRNIVWPLLAHNKIKPVIDLVYPLADADGAHQRMQNGDHIGKLVLQVSD